MLFSVLLFNPVIAISINIILTLHFSSNYLNYTTNFLGTQALTPLKKTSEQQQLNVSGTEYIQ